MAMPSARIASAYRSRARRASPWRPAAVSTAMVSTWAASSYGSRSSSSSNRATASSTSPPRRARRASARNARRCAARACSRRVDVQSEYGSRGGCSCAGPYGHRLLGIDDERSLAIDAEVARGRLGAKPGWARLSFNYFHSDAVASYLIGAVDLLALYGHRLLGDYVFDPRSGGWHHRDRAAEADTGLAELLMPPERSRCLGEDALAGHLEAARELLEGRDDEVRCGPTGLPSTFEELREFHLPPECVAPIRRD
jgi:hypothetical protein